MILEAGKEASVREAHVAYMNTLRSSKADQIEAINEQVRDLKNAMKADKKVEHIKEIAQLKAEKQTIKTQYKQNVQAAKLVLKEIEKQETTNLKSNSQQIKTNKGQIRAQEKSEIETLKTNKTKTTGAQVSAVRKQTHQELVKVEAAYRQPYVAQYQEKVGIGG
jgi:hypothetical protein